MNQLLFSLDPAAFLTSFPVGTEDHYSENERDGICPCFVAHKEGSVASERKGHEHLERRASLTQKK